MNSKEHSSIMLCLGYFYFRYQIIKAMMHEYCVINHLRVTILKLLILVGITSVL